MTKKKKTILQEDIEKECIAIVDRERTNWEEAVTFINPKVGFRMRELIRIFRKNFWGVFDEPIDRTTQREKTWIHLAQSTVETWLKNIDIDTKDISFIARREEGHEVSEVSRIIVKDYLDRMYFGETLDSDERQVLMDGTVVWKTWEDNSSGKPVLKRRTVDLLNVYIDPTEENIQEAYRFTERAIMLPEQIESMTGWQNTRDLDGSQILNRVDGSRRSNFGTRTTANYRDVWECWGKIPKWLVTKDRKAADAMDEIDGHIVVSGLEAPDPTLHLVEENTRKDYFGNSLKPYEEWRACKIAGRWYGLGVIERILALQEWLNTVINIRIGRSYVSQLGLFKIRKGKGITPAMLAKLAVNGAIAVTDMDDVQQFQMQDASPASYQDEEVIKYWAQQVSSAFPISSGDTMPASTSATAAAVANTNAKSSYTMFKEGMGIFIERWIDRHALPIIVKTVDEGDIHCILSDDERWKKLTETIAYNEAEKVMNETGIVPTQMELQSEIERFSEGMLKRPGVFIKLARKIVADEIQAKVHITNEDLDSSVTIANLIQMLNVAPEYREGIVRDIYDLMGLSVPKAKPVAPPESGMPGVEQPNLTTMTQQAMQPVGR